MRIKKGANIIGLQPCVAVAIQVAEYMWGLAGFDKGQPIVLTSGVDGAHDVEGAHPGGWAVDLRNYGPLWHVEWNRASEELRSGFAKALQGQLGKRWLVLDEVTHFHIQVRKEWRR